MVLPEGRVTELGGGLPVTTNNQMELKAVIAGLSWLQRFYKDSAGIPSSPISIYTDSVYAIRGITQWIWAWRTRGWKTSEGEDVSNQSEWKQLLALVTALKPAGIHWHFVRGHIGVPGNERCDEIAVSISKGRHVDLYNGSLLNYSVAIHDIPEDTSLPEMKPMGEKKPKAFSYLSVIGGVVMRHMDWSSCERRVKGQSGAKFKKALSQSDESEILKSWGLDPKTTKIQSV